MKNLLLVLISLGLLCCCSEKVRTESSNQTLPSAVDTPTPIPTSTPLATPTSTPLVTPTPSPTSGDLDTSDTSNQVGCTSTGHQDPRRAEMLDNHELWFGSLVGSSLDEGYKLLSGGSVPDGLLYQDAIHLWWVSSEDHTIHHGFIEEDLLVDLGSISVDGEIFSGMVDPDLVELDDGSLGLTVLDGFDRPGSPGPICHLRSNDGQNFLTHTTMLDIEERFDPSVVVVQDHWWLAVGIPSEEDSFTEIYSGLDGENFTLEGQVNGAVPDISYSNGEFQLLTCSPDGMMRYSSSDGKGWSLVDTIRFPGCDPSTVPGTDFFVYKKEQGGGREIPPPPPGEPPPGETPPA